jgi:hypothetical protein
LICEGLRSHFPDLGEEALLLGFVQADQLCELRPGGLEVELGRRDVHRVRRAVRGQYPAIGVANHAASGGQVALTHDVPARLGPVHVALDELQLHQAQRQQ